MESFYFSTGIETIYSRFEKQEWLENSLEGFIYQEQYEIGEVVLNEKIDRDILEMEASIFGNNPYPKNEPYRLRQSFFTINFPINFLYASNSDKWMLSSGFIISARVNPSSSSKFISKIFENPSLGVNVNLDLRIYKNWYISFSYINHEKGVYLASRNYLKSRNQHIISFGLSCLIKP